jgi:formate hydrogenlyase subunit 4
MNAWLYSLINVILFLVLSPLIAGFVKWCKCILQNRRGPSILQPYRSLNKLFRKQVLLPTTASQIFRVTPYIVFSTTILISSVVPLFFIRITNFAIADVIVLVGIFSLARFFLALAGMDVGTTFGGMGSSREMLIAAIAEPAVLMAFFTLSMIAYSTDLNNIIFKVINNQVILLRPSLIFAAVGFALVALAETGRIPVDNPATHLELTMVHEAMILEYSGRYLAMIEWAAQLKFMIYCVLLINLFFPWGIATNFNLSSLISSGFLLIAKLLVVCVSLVVAEISLAKLRLFRVPYLLNIAFLLCLLGVLSHIILEPV